jgi:hypothetical protein
MKIRFKSSGSALAFGLLFGLVRATWAGPVSGEGAPFLVVSDIDDTIKITHVDNKPAAAIHGLFGKQVFAGMSELYQELAKNTEARASADQPVTETTVYLSASPTFLKNSLHKMLVERHHFPEGRVLLRHWGKDGNVRDYKTNRFNQLITETPLPFILVGDDTESDPQTFTKFAKAHEGRILAAYIRRNDNKPLPAGVTGIYTAFDMALGELEAGRLRPEQAVAVGEAILNEPEAKHIFPSFSHCPKEELPLMTAGPAASANTNVMSMKKLVEERVLEICQRR